MHFLIELFAGRQWSERSVTQNQIWAIYLRFALLAAKAVDAQTDAADTDKNRKYDNEEKQGTEGLVQSDHFYTNL